MTGYFRYPYLGERIRVGDRVQILRHFLPPLTGTVVDVWDPTKPTMRDVNEPRLLIKLDAAPAKIIPYNGRLNLTVCRGGIFDTSDGSYYLHMESEPKAGVVLIEPGKV